MLPMTKGTLIKELKAKGVRKGINSKGALVSLEHLKYEEVINLHAEVLSGSEGSVIEDSNGTNAAGTGRTEIDPEEEEP